MEKFTAALAYSLAMSTAIIRLQEQRGHYIMVLIRLGLGRFKRILQL